MQIEEAERPLLTAGSNRTSRDQSHGCIVVVQHRRCLVRGRCSFGRSPCGLPPAGLPGGVLLRRLDVLLQPPPRPSCVPRGRQSGRHALLRGPAPPPPWRRGRPHHRNNLQALVHARPGGPTGPRPVAARARGWRGQQQQVVQRVPGGHLNRRRRRGAPQPRPRG